MSLIARACQPVFVYMDEYGEGNIALGHAAFVAMAGTDRYRKHLYSMVYTFCAGIIRADVRFFSFPARLCRDTHVQMVATAILLRG